MVLFVKGIIIGISINVLHVSFAVLFVILNLYDKLINIFTDNKNIINNVKYFLVLVFGIIVGFISGNNFINHFISNYNMPLMIFFVGLMYGGISLYTKKIRNKVNVFNIIACLVSFFVILLLNLDFFNISNIYLKSLFGILSFVVPGIKCSFLFDFIDLNFLNIIFLVISLFCIFLVIRFLLYKYNEKLHFALRTSSTSEESIEKIEESIKYLEGLRDKTTGFTK